MKKIVLMVAALLLVVSFLSAGVEFRSQTTTVYEESKKLNNSFTTLTSAQGGNVKQLFEKVSGDNPMLVQGGYWLFLSDRNAMYLVNPQEKTYSEIPLGPMLQFVGVAGKLVKMKIENPVVKVEKIGNETLHGHACEHFRITVEYDMQVKIAFIKKKTHQKSVKDVWSTRAIKALAEIGESFRTRDFKTGFEDLDELIAEQTKAEAAAGFPLKFVQVNYSTDKKGRESVESQMTMEVSDLAVKNLDASLFKIPDGYQRQQMFPGGQEE